jgi:hypothetical protein
MIDVWRDTEGVRIALEEMFEEDFARARLDREAEGANAETRERMEARLPKRTLASGYYRFGDHLFHLDALRRAGITFAARDLAACEIDGIIALDRSRTAFESKHPSCGGCGCRLQNRFCRDCEHCGVKFQRKSK